MYLASKPVRISTYGLGENIECWGYKGQKTMLHFLVILIQITSEMDEYTHKLLTAITMLCSSTISKKYSVE